jgi:hypothetical protein
LNETIYKFMSYLGELKWLLKQHYKREV